MRREPRTELPPLGSEAPERGSIASQKGHSARFSVSSCKLQILSPPSVGKLEALLRPQDVRIGAMLRNCYDLGSEKTRAAGLEASFKAS